MGIFGRRSRRREQEEAAQALVEQQKAVIRQHLEEFEAGTRLFSAATAHTMFGLPPRISGSVECWDETFQFKPEGTFTDEEAWRIPKTQIDGVRDGDEPGELMITFRPPSPFMAITVKPTMHEDEWRKLPG
ncbi:hypothetical protein [Streptomyces sp. NPDC057582]|uniref:hypothetical protein n=1 Tax=Streptomyces sp. NPDC057582 TaxID=3346174 RepID=UPI0036C345E2